MIAKNRLFTVLALWVIPIMGGCFVLNNPYPKSQSAESIYYTSFSEQPKTLDPAKSYSSNESQFTGQIYEPLLQYDYFKRPYQLIPLTAETLPEVTYLDYAGRKVSEDDLSRVRTSIYTIRIKRGIFYQPHPAFAKNEDGNYLYHQLPKGYLDSHGISKLSDFPKMGTRELIVDDYLYQIKRMANPNMDSPISSLMGALIVGFDEFYEKIPKTVGRKGYLDLRKYALSGIKKIDNYTFEIKIKGAYPQFLYWLAMPFFAPIPWEAEQFYNQPGMDEYNFDLGWYPVGTGPFMMTENNPNRHMILSKNPNYHLEVFPNNASEEDKANGFAHHPGERLPLIDKAMFILEKESIPRWAKFLQGYYDLSWVSNDSFDQVVRINSVNEPMLTDAMKQKGLRLTQTDDPSIYYMGFNMLDRVVGGYSQRARLLRQAISIAVNFDEQIAIFLNGRGRAAQGPIPAGIFGHLQGEQGVNPYVYTWQNNHLVRKSIGDAKQLMREAGYPDGIDPQTGKPLLLHYDVPITPGPDDKSQLNWMIKQFAQIGIALNIRPTEYNRFQEKMRAGNAQIFSWGWNADYPDPENFLYLLYGPNGKVLHGGENAANYSNPTFDSLFEAMKPLPNNKKREMLIQQLLEVVRHDAPWAFGVTTQSLMLSQQWIAPSKPNTIGQNTLKFISIDAAKRSELRAEWNQPILWPMVALLMCVIGLFLPFWFAYKTRRIASAARIIE